MRKSETMTAKGLWADIALSPSSPPSRVDREILPQLPLERSQYIGIIINK